MSGLDGLWVLLVASVGGSVLDGSYTIDDGC